MSNRQRRPDRRSQQSSAKWTWWALSGIVGAVAVVAVVLAVTSALGGGAGNIADDLTPRQIDEVLARSHVKGSPQAPVTIIEFADFQCPFCRQFWAGPLGIAQNAYVSNGVARVAFHHMAFLGEESRRAAEASECAAEQDRFFEYHDVLFDKQGPENAGYLTSERLTTFAGDAGLDVTTFAVCLASRRYQGEVTELTAEATKIGVNSTPTVLVNGKRIPNPLDTAALLNAIEAARKEGG